MSYLEKFMGIMNPEVCEVLDNLISKLEELRSGKVEDELNERIWEKFEQCRKIQALREKPTVQMRGQHDLERLYNERGQWRKKQRELENQTMEVISGLTRGLKGSINQVLTEIAEGVNEKARTLVKTTMDRISNLHYVGSISFRSELEKLGTELDGLGDIKGICPKADVPPVTNISPSILDQAKVVDEQLKSLLNGGN